MPKAELAAEWITKELAAKLLGVNVRQVEKRIAAGSIEKRRLPKLPTESVGRVEVARADVDALLAGTPNSHAVEVVKHGSDDVASPNRSPDLHHPFALVKPGSAWPAAARFEMAREFAAKPSAPRAWLTLDEAVQHSGLPQGVLEALVRSNTIFSIGRGAKTWRIQRASLDAFGSEAKQ